jgi:transcriptional regulator with XRE-family HTH domain
VATLPAAALLRSARTNRGITQRALAASCRIHQPGISAIESGAEDATVGRLDGILAHLGSHLAAKDERSAWREIIQLNDDLRRVDGATRVALVINPPAPTGDVRFDALIAGVIDCALTDDALPLPTWLQESKYTLSEPWDVEEVPSLRRDARRNTPAPLVLHGIYLDRSVLVSV